MLLSKLFFNICQQTVDLVLKEQELENDIDKMPYKNIPVNNILTIKTIEEENKLWDNEFIEMLRQ